MCLLYLRWGVSVHFRRLRSLESANFNCQDEGKRQGDQQKSWPWRQSNPGSSYTVASELIPAPPCHQGRLISTFTPSLLTLLDHTPVWAGKSWEIGRTWGRCGKRQPSWAFSLEDILTCLARKSTGVNNKLTDGWIQYSCLSFGILVPSRFAHRHTLMASCDSLV